MKKLPNSALIISILLISVLLGACQEVLAPIVYPGYEETSQAKTVEAYTPTITATATPTETATPTNTPTPTETPVPTDTPTPTETATPTLSPTPTIDPEEIWTWGEVATFFGYAGWAILDPDYPGDPVIPPYNVNNREEYLEWLELVRTTVAPSYLCQWGYDSFADGYGWPDLSDREAIWDSLILIIGDPDREPYCEQYDPNFEKYVPPWEREE